MTFKKNKYVKHILSLFILTSCATGSKNIQNQTFQAQIPQEERVLEEILEYKKFFDSDLNVVHSAQQEYSLQYPKDGWVEIQPDKLMSSVYKTFDPVLEFCPEILTVGITDQRETTLVWDAKTGNCIYNAIVWQDRRTAGQCLKLKEDGFEGVIKSKTGLLLDPYFSSTKISWILDNVNGARKKAENGELRFGTVDTYLLWQLSDGKIFKTDVTNASRTNLYNIKTKSWDEELLEIFGIPNLKLQNLFYHSVRILQLCTALPSGSNALVSPTLSSRKIACKMHSTWFKIECKKFRRSIFACIVIRYFLNL